MQNSVACSFETKTPSKESVVCISSSSKKKKPTKLHPDPELYLGYDDIKTRRIVSETASSSNEDIEGRPHKLNSNLTKLNFNLLLVFPFCRTRAAETLSR